MSIIMLTDVLEEMSVCPQLLSPFISTTLQIADNVWEDICFGLTLISTSDQYLTSGPAPGQHIELWHFLLERFLAHSADSWVLILCNEERKHVFCLQISQ